MSACVSRSHPLTLRRRMIKHTLRSLLAVFLSSTTLSLRFVEAGCSDFPSGQKFVQQALQWQGLLYKGLLYISPLQWAYVIAVLTLLADAGR